jgi:hypothetical protein
MDPSAVAISTWSPELDGRAADGCDTLVTTLLAGEVPAYFVIRRVGFDLLDLAYDHAACLAGDGTVTAPATVGTMATR